MPTYVAVFRSGETVRTQKLSLPERFSVDDLDWDGIGGRSVLKLGESLLWGDHMIALFHADDLPGEKANPSGPAD